MPGVMIVRKRVDGHSAALDLPAIFHPLLHFAAAINDGLIPNLRQHLNSLAIAQPAYVSKVRRHRIVFLEQLGCARHPGLVLQHERDVILPKQVQKLRLNPRFVSYLDGKLLALRQLLEKCLQPRQELHSALEYLAFEVRELKQQRPQPVTQQAHGFDELCKLLVAFQQAFFVRDRLRNLRCNDESLRRSISPASDGGSRRRGIKSGINLDRPKFRGVVAEVIRRLHSRWIKCSVPPRSRESRRTEINSSAHAASISSPGILAPPKPSSIKRQAGRPALATLAAPPPSVDLHPPPN